MRKTNFSEDCHLFCATDWFSQNLGVSMILFLTHEADIWVDDFSLGEPPVQSSFLSIWSKQLYVAKLENHVHIFTEGWKKRLFLCSNWFHQVNHLHSCYIVVCLLGAYKRRTFHPQDSLHWSGKKEEKEERNRKKERSGGRKKERRGEKGSTSSKSWYFGSRHIFDGFYPVCSTEEKRPFSGYLSLTWNTPCSMECMGSTIIWWLLSNTMYAVLTGSTTILMTPL